MQFITDIFLAIILSYLSFTNNLADRILSFFPESEERTIAEELTQADITEDTVPVVAGEISFIPDILKRSSAYQQATALTTLEQSTYTDNPIEAIVNIFCQSTTRRTIRTTTGTGFFIHNKGIILTNAHVAQYLLLQYTDAFGETNCTIRTGNPAAPRYVAQLLYLPPSWIIAHARSIVDEAPTGTGERDYALLYVTKSVDDSPLPDTFPALRLNTNLLTNAARNQRVIASGYPAEAMLRSGNNDNLIPRSAESSISELYTFGSQKADVFSIKGTLVGEQGSSGGPITNTAARVIGMISTRGDDQRDGPGSLRAITASHIDSTMLEETGFSLARNISGDVANRADIFTTTLVPLLTELLVLQNTQ